MNVRGRADGRGGVRRRRGQRRPPGVRRRRAWAGGGGIPRPARSGGRPSSSSSTASSPARSPGTSPRTPRASTPTTAPHVAAVIDAAVAEQRDFTMEHRRIRPDGAGAMDRGPRRARSSTRTARSGSGSGSPSTSPPGSSAIGSCATARSSRASRSPPVGWARGGGTPRPVGACGRPSSRRSSGSSRASTTARGSPSSARSSPRTTTCCAARCVAAVEADRDFSVRYRVRHADGAAPLGRDARAAPQPVRLGRASRST